MSESITMRVDRSALSEILIGEGIASKPPMPEPFRRALVVVDEAVAGLHAARVDAIASSCAVESRVLLLEAGEETKTVQRAQWLLEACDAFGLMRNDALIAVGGGTITDVTAFTAQMYLRGIPLVLMPTSLLAQVDAAIGGKNCLNLDSHKNRLGSFYHPRWVVCDTAFLTTLPLRHVLSGLAEVVKVHAVTGHRAMADQATWDKTRPDCGVGTWPDLVARSARAKVDLLAPDPFEESQQRLLNFGHTFAHALEEMSAFELAHGEAVMLSMLCEIWIGRLAGICSEGTFEAFRGVVDRIMPQTCREFRADGEQIREALLATRQLRGGHDHLVVLQDTGRGGFLDDVPESLAVSAWEEMMAWHAREADR